MVINANPISKATCCAVLLVKRFGGCFLGVFEVLNCHYKYVVFLYALTMFSAAAYTYRDDKGPNGGRLYMSANESVLFDSVEIITSKRT